MATAFELLGRRRLGDIPDAELRALLLPLPKRARDLLAAAEAAGWRGGGIPGAGTGYGFPSNADDDFGEVATLPQFATIAVAAPDGAAEVQATWSNQFGRAATLTLSSCIARGPRHHWRDVSVTAALALVAAYATIPGQPAMLPVATLAPTRPRRA